MAGISSPSLKDRLARSGVVSDDSSIAWDCMEALTGDGPLNTSWRTEEEIRGDGEGAFDIVGVVSVGGVASGISC